jgi:N-acetylmuramoyl-L-alanine amidase
LSGKVSDEEARRMAEKENASDLLAGADIATDEEAGDVKGILIDLLKRETANFSTDFSNVVVRRLGKAIPLARDPQRSAAFKVLRQTHAPSVLIELGYLSHTEDQKLMGTTEWQRRVAGAIADAVDAYFAKRTANTP